MKTINKSYVLKLREEYDALDYKDKIAKFEALQNNTCYSILNEEEFQKMWGYSFSQIEGFDNLGKIAKEATIKGILYLASAGGMDYKADSLVYKVKVDTKQNCIVAHHCGGFTYISAAGTVG